MFKTLRGRIITILFLTVVAGWQLYSKGIKLGLDLRGGMHLVLEIDDPEGTMTAEAKADMIDRVDRIIRTRIDEFGVEEPLIQKVGGERLIVELAGISDEDRAKEIIQRNAFLEFKLVLPTTDMTAALSRIDRTVVAALGLDSIRALGRDVVSAEQSPLVDILFGGGDTAVSTEQIDTAEVVETIPEEEDQLDNFQPFSTLLNIGDVEGTYLIAVEDIPLVELFLGIDEVQRAMPRDQVLQWGMEPVGRGARTYRYLYVLEEDAFLTGDRLESATAGRDPQFNQSQVQFELSRAGGRSFSQFTGQHVGDLLAIVLDGRVQSAPVIRDRIGARGQIDMGSGTPLEEASDLALVLRAGALPAKINIIEERTVGPSLGQDSIDAGRIAGMLGMALVMIAYYRIAGILAVGALGVYVVLVLGGLAGIGATLTVPGIAGLILSVGMAVDANVLIFERIREELAVGRATRTAVEEGFQHAFSAILDANMTTLITALILFQFGTGPVRGFAVTLSMGIVASFFSALFVTRSFFLLYLKGKKASDPISV